MLSFRTSLFFAFLFILQIAKAQFNVLGTATLTESYSAREKMQSRALSLNDGGAVVAAITEKLLYVSYYGSNRKLKVKKTIPVEGGNPVVTILAIVESAESISVLYQSILYERNQSGPCKVYRVTVSKVDGSITENKAINDFLNDKYSTTTQDEESRTAGFFDVKKEEGGNRYVLISYGLKKSIGAEVIYFNAENKEIGRASFPSKIEQKDLNVLDAVVIGEERVAIIAATENGLYWGSIKTGEEKAVLTKLKYSTENQIESCVAKYSPALKAVYLLVSETVGKKDPTFFANYTTTYYSTKILNIKLDSLAVKTKKIDLAPVSEIATRDYAKKSGYEGIADKLFVKDDGGFVVVCEGVTQELSSSSTSYTRLKLHDIGVLDFSKESTVRGATYIPKWHDIPISMGMVADPKLEPTIQWNKGFKSYLYVNAEPNGYVLFNDVAKNQEKIDSKKEITGIMGVGPACEGFLFKTGENNIPERQAIFGDIKKVGFFLGADYNKKTKTLVTVAREGEDGKTAQLAWIKIE